MKKDAFYFPHDSNAKDDPNVTLLIDQLGLEGYGIFWVLIETLRDQPGYKYPLQLLPSLARKYATTFEKIKTVVFNYDLFQIEEDKFFYSKSLIERMKPLELSREQRRLAGLKSGEKRKKVNIKQTTDERPLNGNQMTDEQSKVEYSIVEESKEENSIVEDKILPYFATFLTINECEVNCLADEIWLEPIQMKHKLNSELTTKLIKDFSLKLKCDGEIEKTLSDYKKHFNNWLPFELKNNPIQKEISADYFPPYEDIEAREDKLREFKIDLAMSNCFTGPQLYDMAKNGELERHVKL